MISCSTSNFIALLGKRWMPHMISTFNRKITMSFWDCKRAFPFMTDRVISARLKEMVMLELLEIWDDKKYSITPKMKKVDEILMMLEKL